jgi:hypothetical protein
MENYIFKRHDVELETFIYHEEKNITQWKVFIQKGGQIFFLFRFSIFGVKIMFSLLLGDTKSFFGEICPGQFVGQNSGNIALIASWEKYKYFQNGVG